MTMMSDRSSRDESSLHRLHSDAKVLPYGKYMHDSLAEPVVKLGQEWVITVTS